MHMHIFSITFNVSRFPFAIWHVTCDVAFYMTWHSQMLSHSLSFVSLDIRWFQSFKFCQFSVRCLLSGRSPTQIREWWRCQYIRSQWWMGPVRWDTWWNPSIELFVKLCAAVCRSQSWYFQEFRPPGTKSSMNAVLPPTLTSLSQSGK